MRIRAGIGAAVWRRSFQGGAVDVALGGVGVALAGLSLLFAAEMIRRPREPYIPGVQYLAIFAQPNSSALKAAQKSLSAANAPPKTSNDVDYTSTASISERKQPQIPKEPLDELTEYEILGATKEVAWLRRGSEIVEVRPGDYLPGFGKILSIEQQAGRWRLVVKNGGPQFGKASPEAPGRGAAKSLIFTSPSR